MSLCFSHGLFSLLFLGEDQNLPKGFVDCPKKGGRKILCDFFFFEERVDECFTAFMLCCVRISFFHLFHRRKITRKTPLLWNAERILLSKWWTLEGKIQSDNQQLIVLSNSLLFQGINFLVRANMLASYLTTLEFVLL